MLRLPALVAACAIALTLSFAARDAEADVLPPQGLYDACYPGRAADGCASRLQRMGQAGFKLVLNYWLLAQSTSQQILDYAAKARAAGLQVIWPLNDWWTQDPNANNMLRTYHSLAASCHSCSTNHQLVNYIESLAKRSSNTWGYYVADEPDPSKHAQLQAFAGTVHADDPSRPLLIVACGACASGDPTGAHAAPFADIDAVLGTDEYPILPQAPDLASITRWVGGGMEGLQGVDDASRRSSAVVLQAFNWGDGKVESQMCGSSPANCHFPSRDEMQAQRDAALSAGHPQLILWFGLFDILGYPAGEQSSNWTVPPNPEQRWSDLAAAAFAPYSPAPPVPPPPPPQPQPQQQPQPVDPVPTDAHADVWGRHRLGRITVTARIVGGTGFVTLRSGALKLRRGRRYLVRSCIAVVPAAQAATQPSHWDRCRRRWIDRRGRHLHAAKAAPVKLQIGRPQAGQPAQAVLALVTVWVRGHRGHLVQVASSAPHGDVHSAALSLASLL